MNEFYLTFWELQEIWNMRVVSVKTDKNPLKLTIDDINDVDFDIEWIDVLHTDYGDITKIDAVTKIGIYQSLTFLAYKQDKFILEKEQHGNRK